MQKLKHTYDSHFKVSEDYRASLPDMQNSDAGTIAGAKVPILEVGSSNFKLPLNFLTVSGDTVSLETSVTGAVSVGAETKGINMSRIIRTVYDFKEATFTLDLLKEILTALCQNLESERARLKLHFSYPILQTSLRSDLQGYQYYPVAYEGVIDAYGCFRKYLYFDFTYSSACPCSSLLSEHARDERSIYSIPHSQRSKTRVSVEVAEGISVFPENLYEHCLNALKTETQVMVKREDEQAFAELNGVYVKFVEDAVRLVYEQLIDDQSIIDFQVVCAHLESLHAYDAVAVVTRGMPDGFNGYIEDFRSLIC